MSQPFRTSKLFDANYLIPEGCELTINRGGTSSGKTYSILQVLFLKAFEFPESVITVVGQDIPNLKKGAIRDAFRIYNSSPFIQSIVKDYNKTDRIFTFHNGSQIEFNSYDDEQDAKNGKREFAFFNEVNGISFEIFDAVYVRTTKHAWADFNPSSPFWLTDKNMEGWKETRTIKSTFKHNPFLEEKTVQKILSYEPTPENIANGTANEYRWKVYGLGEYAALEGAIFTRWKKGTFNDTLPYIFGVDWGIKDPFVLLKVAADYDKRLLYVKELVYEPTGHRGEAWLKRMITHHCSKDDLIIADLSEMITINSMRNEGYNMNPCFKRPGIVVERIKWIQDFQIIIDDSPNLENELNNYIWADKRGEVPIDSHNHAIDALGYAVTYLKMNVWR